MSEVPEEERSVKEMKLMKEAKKRYISELQKRLQQLKEQLQSLQESVNIDALLQFRQLVSLLGSHSPMFGLSRFGELASKLLSAWEHAGALDELVTMEDGKPKGDSLLNESEALLRLMHMELAASSRELDLDDYLLSQSHALSSNGERLLVIDGDEKLRHSLVQCLQAEGYIVDESSDVETAVKLLRENSYDLILLELMLYPGSGYELFDFLKEDPTLKWVPLIVLSARNRTSDKVRCFRLGADDFAAKPFQYEELSARIHGLLRRTKNFEQMAFRDPLTGVYNRRFFDHQILVELQRIGRYPAFISLIFIDIDRFKQVNDTLGHHVGDLVLQGVAHLLQNQLRATDLVARYGGEEFVVVMPNTPGKTAKKAIENVLQRVRTEPVAENEGQPVYVTFSAGISEWQAGMSVEEWVRRSDAAMYTAKQTGRNKAVLADSGEVDTSVQPANNKMVLVADDDRILRSIVMAKLKHLPIQFIEAADGEEAYELLCSQMFDLCILDGIMPHLDGFGMLERMKERGTKPAHTRFLILSGRTREDDVARGLQLGADVYMHKPFSMVELELEVKQLLKLSKNN